MTRPPRDYESIVKAYEVLEIDPQDFRTEMQTLAQSFGLKSTLNPATNINDTIVRLSKPATAASLAQSIPLVIGDLINSSAISNPLKTRLKAAYPSAVLNKPLIALTILDARELRKTPGFGDAALLELLIIRNAEQATAGFVRFKNDGGKALRKFTGFIGSIQRPKRGRKPGLG